MNEAFWMLTTVVFGIATGCLTQAWLGARAEVARLRRNGSAFDPAASLQRVETAVEAIAIELERVAERQRFGSQLLAKPVAPVPPAA